MMYADFESTLMPIQGSSSNPREPYAEGVALHAYTFHLVGVFTASSLMETLKIH